MEKRTNLLLMAIAVLMLLVYMASAGTADLPPLENNIDLSPKLSAYHIFQGAAADLTPAAAFKNYELATTLFTDYAEKQRLIRVPAGFKLTAVNDGLPDFPDGSILVKTFYYYNDKRDPSKGKHIVETRLMIKSASRWSAGTYQWNREQTEAFLVNKGVDLPVNWLDESGNSRSISYHIPKAKECAACHNADNVFIPIGPKIKNLNTPITRDNGLVNQLAYLQEENILNKVNPSSFRKLPNWQDTSLPLEERARAYLDVNCAHCHSEHGYCSGSKLKLNYELAFEHTRIAKNAGQIDKYMTKKRMPMLGTTVVDKEGLDLIRQYINTLNK